MKKNIYDIIESLFSIMVFSITTYIGFMLISHDGIFSLAEAGAVSLLIAHKNPINLSSKSRGGLFVKSIVTITFINAVHLATYIIASIV